MLITPRLNLVLLQVKCIVAAHFMALGVVDATCVYFRLVSDSRL